MQSMNVKCPGGHQHVRIEGKYTKPSAVYHPELAKFIATKIRQALAGNYVEDDDVKVRIESVVWNDILQQDAWNVESEWKWHKPAHINVLESRSLIALFKKLVLEGGNVRFAALMDSRVAKGAHGKGRSSARALRPSLLRGCAYTIAGGLYPAYGFAPTRLNTADAPTRDKPLPVAAKHSILDFLSQWQISELHAHQFSRATAGWIRLYILAAFCLFPGESCQPSSAKHAYGFWDFPFLYSSLIIAGLFLLCHFKSPQS